MQYFLDNFAASKAFIKEFSSKVTPVSSGLKFSGGKINSIPEPLEISLISASL